MNFNAGRFCDSFFPFSRYSFGGIIMFILGLLLIASIVYFIINRRNSGISKMTENPLEILQKRYIIGEINQEEYLEKKDILKK